MPNISPEIEQALAKVANARIRQEARVLLDLMHEATSLTPYLSGKIIGFGRYHYQYDSGHSGSAIVTGFAPTKTHFTVYIMPGFADYQGMLARLGKHRSSKSCLYINKLADVDLTELSAIVKRSATDMAAKYTIEDVS